MDLILEHLRYHASKKDTGGLTAAIDASIEMARHLNTLNCQQLHEVEKEYLRCMREIG